MSALNFQGGNPQDAHIPPGWYTDPSSGLMRWWDGTTWGAYRQAVSVVSVRNGYATGALVLGICGFVLMGIPFFIGWFLGGIPDLLAVIFGIIGIGRANAMGGVGRAAAVVGLVLGGVSLFSVFLGAGSIW